MVSRIAQNIVNQSLRIKENDVVLIIASGHMPDLADEVTVESRKAGAETTTIFWSEPVWYWSLAELPFEWLRGPSRTDLALLDVATAVVNLESVADPKPMARISSERWAANSEGANHWYRKYIERKPRSVSLSLTSVTPQRARAYRFSYPAWKRNTENALKANYSRISTTGKKLQNMFDNSNQKVHITANNGTDLSFRLAGRKSLMDDGIIDDSDLASGSFETMLPAGFINIAPEEQSANGNVVFDLPVPQRGKLVRDLSWHFKNGQLTKFVAAKNSETVLPMWEGSTGEKSRFGSFRIGFNYAAKVGFLNNFIVSGTVTLGIGENKILGGENESTFGFQGTLGKSTVVIDGQTLVSEGKLAV
jgi:leucyl aminopeptidase (aminopeptidase T)